MKKSFSALFLATCGLFAQQTSTAAISFTNYPLAGYAKLPPNVLILMSVEWPMASGVYNKPYGDNFTDLDIRRNLFLGYFDSNLCYTYTSISTADKQEDGYFQATSKAGSEYLCSGTKKEFSGNFLNALTTSGVDIFRRGMTGGNRAKGIGTDKSNYEAGDTPSETYIRRSAIYAPASIAMNKNLVTRYLGVTSQGGRPGSGDVSIIRRLTPYDLQQFNTLTKENRTGLSFHSGPWNNFGHQFSFAAEIQNVYSPIGTTLYKGESSSARLGLGADEKQVFNLVLKACSTPSLLESNCQPNSVGYYKPEGVMQKYSKQMRFGIFGYGWRAGVNDGNNDGGIMRSRLKLLGVNSVVKNKSGTINHMGQEIDPSTGQFLYNPDTDDASSSGVENSGVINYINQFAERNQYRSKDFSSRMYYPALRYLRGLPNPNKYTDSFTTAQLKDYFPVITDWDDPVQRDALNGCKRKNVMLAIGDTNVHDSEGTAAYKPPGYGTLVNDDSVNYREWTKKAINHERATGSFSSSISDTSEDFGMPLIGMAYYAHTSNIRPDLPDEHTADTVTIDIVENGTYKWNYNPYWLAAKYGGFNDFNGDGKPGPDRKEWTDDPAGSTSFSAFSQGMPNNFSLASGNDANFVDALKKAFSSVGKASLSQASVASPPVESVIKDPLNPTLKIITRYFTSVWTGDVIGIQGDNKWSVSSALNSQFAGDGWKNRKVFVQDSISTKRFNETTYASLSNEKRSALDEGGYGADRVNYILGDRSKEGRVQESAKPFRKRDDSSLLGTIVNSPVVFIPGSRSNAEDSALAGCTYADPGAAASRPLSYAFASNDGMLHIVKSTDRTEQMAFLASSMFEQSVSDNTKSKVVQYTRKDYEHEYTNDGVPVTREMCFPQSGNKIRSILVGTAGRGGHSVYAIDGTDLSTPSESNVLWEFTNKDDADLGLTVSTPILAYDHAKRPIAIISSGYNTPSNKTSVFILRLDKNKSESWVKGTNYYKIEVGAASSGLGSIELVDKNQDGQPDLFYVGDIEGRLWKIDASSSDIGNWGNKLGAPLFTAKASDGHAQSIVAKPTYAKEDGKEYVFFGTGRFFSATDTQLTNQSVYGIIDANSAISGSGVLTVQSSTTAAGTSANGGTLFNTTDNPLGKGHAGWRFDLSDRLMVIEKVTYYQGAVFVPVFMPSESTGVISGDDDCSFSGKSGFLALKAANGGMSDTALFDTNGDHLLNHKDTPAGMILFDFTSPSWTLVETENGLEFMATDGEKIISNVVVKPNSGGVVKRLSWRLITED